MRTVLISAFVLICAESVIAQSKPARLPDQNPAAILAAQQMTRRSARRPARPNRGSAVVPPNAPVVTLEGVCDRSRKADATGSCRTVITGAQMDALIDALEPDASPIARRQFAIQYARLLAASDLAEQRHLDMNPAVARELQVQLKLARMQVLADGLLRAIQEQTEDIPKSEIQKYFSEHPDYFDQAALQRLYVPKSAPTDSGQPLDSAAVKTKADELYARAAAGEEFDQLQKEAYKDLGVKPLPPPTKLGFIPRSKLSPDEAKVFDLKPGDVSQLLDSQDAFIVLKLDSKKTISMESARPEIEAILLHDRLEKELSDATKTIKAQFNLKYLDMPKAPELFPPSLLSPTPGKRGTPLTLRP